ncbi:sensor histidine kinase KdpD [Stenotrophomonas sp.]|uniref:sensor histidine kinase KdpD n=1 Tax=Stenotrophomonas sp. TaxID=69392 RepID=UPI0028B0C3BD|nr:sensor histidine kinase KdpD [Stenotrophomonas sp.]
MNDSRSRQADALAEGMQRDAGGKLTVFLGAAPGVGKTFSMLSRAQEQLRRGVDVMAAVVETHGRSDTAALLDGLPRIAMRTLEYHGHQLQELDLDAVLARRPALVLVDELAHRNAPGSRHERRWQDVMELLDAGIDVWTTINIQHLESLNDVVMRITGVRVSETVPDVVFDRLHDIVLVDLPPRELIERLQQGKVYVPEQAAHALQAFFSPANLTALRELAMQEAADRVDSSLRETRAARGEGNLPLRRRVLVAIDGSGQSEYLVRVARRIAERRDAPWTVVTVQHRRHDEATRREIDAAFALARRLGGDAELLHGPGIADALLDYAAHNAVSSLLLGRTRERPLARLFNQTLTQQLIQRGAHYEITIISTPQARARARRLGRALTPDSSAQDAGLAVAATALACLAAWLGERWLGLSDLAMVFIVAVVLVAARTRMSAAVLAATLCFLAYNFFFIAPRFTFAISARQGVITVFLFLAAALVAGRLASRLRMQVVALRAANRHATVRQLLGRQLAGAVDNAQVAHAGRVALEQALDVPAWVRLGRDTSTSGSSVPGDTDLAAADWTLRHGQPAGRFTDTLAGADWWFVPLLDGDGHGIGAAGLQFDRQHPPLAPEQRQLAEAMADDIAQAALRTRLVADLETAHLHNETERLRSALLSSVSHDLRSPLAAMIGSADSLSNYAQAMDAGDRRALLDTIVVEGERLDRYIQNLLDMTRLGHDGLKLNRDWIGVDELIGSAARRLQRYQPDVHLQLDIPAALAPIWVHPALIEQAVFNVMENAAKFSPPDVPVQVRARQHDGELSIDVIDAGPGIPDAERARIFDMFYSVERGDRGRHGTGLGLTICQGMIGAHGGRVEALAGPDGRGTLIRMSLPMLQPQPETPRDDG